jgi:hypothetical protein
MVKAFQEGVSLRGGSMPMAAISLGKRRVKGSS